MITKKSWCRILEDTYVEIYVSTGTWKYWALIIPAYVRANLFSNLKKMPPKLWFTKQIREELQQFIKHCGSIILQWFLIKIQNQRVSHYITICVNQNDKPKYDNAIWQTMYGLKKGLLGVCLIFVEYGLLHHTFFFDNHEIRYNLDIFNSKFN